jgi:iron complex transport system substrate-binding protein
MKSYRYFSASIIIIALLTYACAPTEKTNAEKIINNTKASENLVKHSKYFSITRLANGYDLAINTPYANEAKHYLLTENNEVNTTIKIPCNKMVLLSSMYCSMITALGNADKVIAIDNINYQTENEIINRFHSGKIKQVNVNQHLDLESLIQLKPDVIIDYSNFYQKENTPSIISKANIKSILFHDYLETSPLARAEWIKVIGILCNNYSLADSLFQQIESNYHHYQSIAAKVKEKKSVFCETEYNGSWYTPGGKSYMAELIQDAGGNYIFSTDTNKGSIPYPFETIFNKAKTADVWINVGQVNSKQALLDQNPKYNWFKAFNTNAIYNNNKIVNKNGGNAIWNRGAIEPHLVLKDLIKLLYPELLPNDTLKYYQKLN